MNGFSQSVEFILNAIKEFLNSPAICALAGAVFGSVITYVYSIRLSRRQSFNEASGRFRATFLEVQRLLDESKSLYITEPGGIRVKTILEGNIVEHEKAMLTFRPYVPKRKRGGFDKAWKTYYSQKNKFAECLSEYDPIHCIPSIDHPGHEENTRKLALSRIEKLLEFATFK